MAEHVYDWSITASDNATADAGINWQENQVPGSVNGSARSMMAAFAKWLKDNNGTKTTSGSANAQTLASPNSNYTALVNGLRTRVKAGFTNTGATTFNLQSLGAKKVLTFGPGNVGVRELLAREIFASGIYDLNYDTAADSGGGAWILLNPTLDPGTVGDIKAWVGSSTPTGWLFCDGTAVSRTTFATLFALVSTTFGSGDGSTTFNLPDLRGRVVAGKDDMNGSAASRLTSASGSGSWATTLGGTAGTETITLSTSQIPSHTHSFSATTGTESATHTHTYSGTTATENATHTHTGSGTTSAESTDHTHSVSGTTGNASADHTHSVSGTTGVESADHVHNVSGTTGAESVDHTHGVSGTTGAGSAHAHGLSTASAASGGAHTHTVTDPGHSHNVKWNTVAIAQGTGSVVNPTNDIRTDGGVTSGSTPNGVVSNTTGISVDSGGAHTHTLSGNTDNESAHTHSFSATSAGVSATHTHNFSATSGGISGNHSHNFSATSGGASATHTHTFSATSGGASTTHTHTYSFTTAVESAAHAHTYSGTTATESATHTHSVSGTTGSAGSDGAHINCQPTIVLNFIIRML